MGTYSPLMKAEPVLPSNHPGVFASHCAVGRDWIFTSSLFGSHTRILGTDPRDTQCRRCSSSFEWPNVAGKQQSRPAGEPRESVRYRYPEPVVSPEIHRGEEKRNPALNVTKRKVRTTRDARKADNAGGHNSK